MEIKSQTGEAGPHYELRDASIRGLVIFGVGLFVTLVVVLILTAELFDYFGAVQSLGPPASPFADARVMPPAPRLQAAPVQDLKQMRESEAAVLTSYGWVDQKAGIVRIPVDRAMDIVLEKGLPVRQENPGKQAGQ